jgi:alanine dehydrogenase
MIIGIPREVKKDEHRIAVPPGGVRELVRYGHQVLVQKKAGLGSGFSDREYQAAGAELVETAAETWIWLYARRAIAVHLSALGRR